MKIDPKLLMSPQQSLDEARVRSLKSNKTRQVMPKLEEVAEAFEGIFVKMLLDRMPEEDPEGIMSSGFGGQMFKGMLHSEYANLAANRTNFGIAGAILRQLQHQSTASCSTGGIYPGKQRLRYASGPFSWASATPQWD